MRKFKKGDTVTFYSRVHQKNINGKVEFKGDQGCIVVYAGARYSLQNTQILGVAK